MPSDISLKTILAETRQLVEQAGGGKRTLTLSPEVAEALAVLSSGAPEEAVEALAETASGEAAASSPESAATLEALEAQVRECTKCGLSRTRNKTVFGAGNPDADLVFVGEAPGGDEDRQGIPFVGRAGQLLTDIIVKGMRMRREDVYICNVLKCRPPGNRDPDPEEVHFCEPYLLRQLELMRPKVICALGRHAAQTLLRTDAPTGLLRNRWHNYHGIPFRVTYHPAYLLRKPGEKRKTWEDVQEIMKVLAGEVVPEI